MLKLFNLHIKKRLTCDIKDIKIDKILIKLHWINYNIICNLITIFEAIIIIIT